LKEAAWLKGTEDLRSIELKKICDIMRNSECVFGPSSGPMHLASLCGAPHIVWSTSKNKTRYEENWNPLSTPVLFLDKHGWHPTAEYVVERFSQWFKKNKEKG
jgi:ADP-heptose:LPS heptosyltransferase